MKISWMPDRKKEADHPWRDTQVEAIPECELRCEVA
jgi:hypothetical protein